MFSLFSPAKINLFLRIKGIRTDGYHEIHTLMQTISLGDHLHFHIQDSKVNFSQLTCNDPRVPLDNTNLILKAADLFRKKTGLTFSLNIELEKNTPMEAGLGGGSSNAATTLWALASFFLLKIEDSMLAEWAAEIGSDIPFFFSKGAAICEGRGESMTESSVSPEQPLLIVKPNFGLSTKSVYDHFRLNFAATEVPNNDTRTLYFNDLEKSAFMIKPELENIRNILTEAGFSTVLMSGSGTAFFCLGHAIPPFREDLHYFPAHFVTRKPGEWYTTKLKSDIFAKE